MTTLNPYQIIDKYNSLEVLSDEEVQFMIGWTQLQIELARSPSLIDGDPAYDLKKSFILSGFYHLEDSFYRIKQARGM